MTKTRSASARSTSIGDTSPASTSARHGTNGLDREAVIRIQRLDTRLRDEDVREPSVDLRQQIELDGIGRPERRIMGMLRGRGSCASRPEDLETLRNGPGDLRLIPTRPISPDFLCVDLDLRIRPGSCLAEASSRRGGRASGSFQFRARSERACPGIRKRKQGAFDPRAGTGRLTRGYGDRSRIERTNARRQGKRTCDERHKKQKLESLNHCAPGNTRICHTWAECTGRCSHTPGCSANPRGNQMRRVVERSRKRIDSEQIDEGTPRLVWLTTVG